MVLRRLLGVFRELRSIRQADRERLLAERQRAVELLDLHDRLESKIKQRAAATAETERQLLAAAEQLALLHAKRRDDFVREQVLLCF